MEKEALFVKHIQDLAALADKRGCVMFTDFLNLNEQNILYRTMQKFSLTNGKTFGGYEGAERKIGALIPQTVLYETCDDDCIGSPDGILYPICCISIRPRAPKFAEQLSHRDILGSLMHLGIDRSQTGDIAVTENESLLFCVSRFSDMICHELTRIRHTEVECSLCRPENFSYVPATRKVQGSIASVRLDSVMALGFGASRSSLLSLIESGNVFVNGKLITSNAYNLKEGDIVSVRGLGRFRYEGTVSQTKKGRYMAKIERYI